MRHETIRITNDSGAEREVILEPWAMPIIVPPGVRAQKASAQGRRSPATDPAPPEQRLPANVHGRPKARIKRKLGREIQRRVT